MCVHVYPELSAWKKKEAVSMEHLLDSSGQYNAISAIYLHITREKAFSNGILRRKMFMKIPERFLATDSDEVCHLKKTFHDCIDSTVLMVTYPKMSGYLLLGIYYVDIIRLSRPVTCTNTSLFLIQ